jgi:putative ABC transport system permease protein
MPVPAALARHTLPGTSLLAWRNLVHDRARFVITLVGIVFSVVLMGVQMGLLVGFARTASGLIDRAGVDLWISAAGTTNVDITGTVPQRWRLQALAVPGVAEAHDYMAQFAFWKKPDGGNESVIMVGIDLADPVGGPWNLVEGSLDDLAIDGGIILDHLYREKLGVSGIGDTLEINNRRARVVGFTDGIRTFTQSPYVFTRHEDARRYTFVDDDRTTYILVRVAPGADVAAVQSALAQRLPDAHVWTTAEFSTQTRVYWLVTTGAGAALSLAALLGLVVGIVIVGQTLYASTIDRLPEYATLRAMGAPHGYLYAVILKQAAISAVLGFAAGFVVTLGAVAISSTGNIAIAMPAWLGAVLALLTGVMCAAGAVISIRRVMRIDPTSVFA